ncbi:hypothetical protein CAEBREN_29682, partial [Caenorhabditis brenneri]
MDEMEMQMNRRTWAALLEMGGILGEDEHEKSEDVNMVTTKVTSKSASFLVGCTLRARNWRVGMPFPKNHTRLGVISLMNTELESTMELSESNANTLAVKLMVDGLRIDDSTPLFSEKYPERLIMIDEQLENGSNGFGVAPTTKRKLDDSKRIVIDFIKYLGEDPKRECDISIAFHVPSNQKFYYVHTHRFFCALLDFWMQFNELMNIVTKSKKLKIEESARTKCALDVDIQCATSLMMPLNSTSSEILLWQADSVELKNTFKTLSALKAEIFDKYSFYVLMRAVIEKNFGEPLIPIPETIPIEILQLPTDVIELDSRLKYATLSFRMIFEDVDLNLEVPEKLGDHQKALLNGEWQKFANVKLERARISFDAFEDGQSELDLICEKVELMDTTNNGPKNCFPVILQHTDTDKQTRPTTPATTPINSSLMLETHIMMKKDECPVLTLVLCNARVILAYDWLDDLKQFLMLYTDFIPKYSDEVPYNLTASGRQAFSTTHDGAIVERNPHSSNVFISSPTFSVKITLRDSDLYILENPFVKNSFAMIASTTAVLNMNDIGGHISANLEIQSMRLAWCSMQHEKQTRNLCSNDFSITISLHVDPASFGNQSKQSKGMTVTPPVRHSLEIELVKMICRLSYKDARALKAIVSGYMKNYVEGQKKPMIPIIVPPIPSKRKKSTRSDSNLNRYYWVCTAIRREYYPENDFESLPGHSIHLVAPLTLQNLLPIDVEVKIQDNVFAIAASKSMLITSVDITKELSISVTTDRLTSLTPLTMNKSSIGEGTLLTTKMVDAKGHLLDMYCHVRLGVGQAISVSFWVPYWIVNKSGLPLIIQQEAVRSEAAGQMEEHEKAKDRHPLMFSFADENCPKACRVRIGNSYISEKGYRSVLSEKFTLTPGVQALKLRVEHKTKETFYYNLGVEVRPGTGRYKDTQVVLLTSRFILQNQSTVALSVCHHDLIDREKDHVHLAAQSSTTWNENYAVRRMLCVRRSDVKHWSCPFLIDRIGSFHVTMRDADETPRFIRVEIILTSAVFQITFTN